MDVITSYHWQLLRVTLCWNRVKGPVISLQHWELYTKHTMVLWGEQLWHLSSAHRSSPLGQRERNSGYAVKDDICEQQKSTENQLSHQDKMLAQKLCMCHQLQTLLTLLWRVASWSHYVSIATLSCRKMELETSRLPSQWMCFESAFQHL